MYWEVQDTVLEDVARIEVIRGPGAALWGANAVNGIINIITKPANQTQGNLLSAQFGSREEQTVLSTRHGGQIDTVKYRIYSKLYQHHAFVNPQGQTQDDNWLMKRGGFRTEWDATKQDMITLQGDIYDGYVKQNLSISVGDFGIFNAHANVHGFNLLTSWKHTLTNGDIILQAYHDHTNRNETFYGESRGTDDINFQHRWTLNSWQELIWGLGFRSTYDEMKNTNVIAYYPIERHNILLSAFIQDELILQPDHWRLTIGTKVENNDYTGLEIQPNIRLLWTLDAEKCHAIWVSVARAVRTPARNDSDLQVKFNPGLLTNNVHLMIVSSTDPQSETLVAYQLGYRFNLSKQFLFDASLFYNDYDKLRSAKGLGLQFFSPTTRL